MNNQNSLNLAKLTFLLQNSRLFSMKPGTFPVVYNKINTKVIKLANLLEKSNNPKVTQNPINLESELYSYNKQSFPNSSNLELNVSKDFVLYFSLIKKPINLIFSIDQLLYEFSKKSFQQKKTGEFLQQLKERKKLSLFYGHLTRKQLVNLFDKVEKNKGVLSRNLFTLLERRLDVVLYRSGFLKTITQARQLVKHQKVRVNSNLVDIPSFLLNPGDVISFVPEILEVLSDELLKSIDSQNLERFSLVEKNQSRVFGDFYSKLALQSFSVPNWTSSSQPDLYKFNNLKTPGILLEGETNSLNFNLFYCNLIIKLLCTKIKSSCFLILKKSRTYSKFFENSLIFNNPLQALAFKSDAPVFPNLTTNNLNKGLGKIDLLQLKWNFFSPTNHFSSREKKLFSNKKNTNQEPIYANFLFLQKKPEFWNRSFPISQNTPSLRPKTSWNTSAKTPKSSRSKIRIILDDTEFLQKTKQQKIVKFVDYRKHHLKLFQKSFLFFFKCLEKHSKFQNLLKLILKKNFFKRCRLSQLSINAEKSTLNYSKHLKFKATKPLHIEISYNLLNIIYLFSPQRVNFPFYVDFDLIKRSLH